MRRVGLVIFACLTGTSQAHQPIMDMAPRWNDGYGAQTRVEYANNETTTWLEGVYTFKPSVRMTLKIPFNGGELGDAILALPLKKYHNEGAFTSNWGLTPSVRIPTDDSKNTEDWDAGLSLSYSSETPDFYQLYDLYTLGGDVGLDINAGFVHTEGKGSALFTLWDLTAFDSDSGQRLLSGPVLVYYRQNIVIRAEFKYPLVDHDSDWDGNYVSLGIGVVY